jgi:hypothetical protein
MLRHVALVRTDVSEEISASVIRLTRIFSHFVFLRSVRRLLVTASVVPSSPNLIMVPLLIAVPLNILMMLLGLTTASVV